MSAVNPGLPGTGVTTYVLRDDGVTSAGVTLTPEVYSPAAASVSLLPALSATEAARLGTIAGLKAYEPRIAISEGQGWAVYQYPSALRAVIARDNGTHLSVAMDKGIASLPLAAATLGGVAGLSPAEQARVSGLAGGASVSVQTTFYANAYGAIGDSDGTSGNGTPNDAAFAALSAAAAAVSNPTLIVPAGIYRFTNPRWFVNQAFPGGFTLQGTGTARLFFDGLDFAWLCGLFVDGYQLVNGVLTRGYVSGVNINNIMVSSTSKPPANTFATPLPDPRALTVWDTATGCLSTFRGISNLTLTNFSATGAPQSFCTVAHDVKGLTGTNLSYTNSQADGLHLTGGTSAVRINGYTANNVGDDAFAVGFQTQADVNDDIVITGLNVNGAGANGVSVYAPAGSVTVNGAQIANTWLSGVSVTPLTITSYTPTNYNVGNGPIGNITITPSTFTNTGLRSTAAYSRGQGTSFGVVVNSGGHIGSVIIQAGQTFTGARNSYVGKSNAVDIGTLTFAPGSTYSGAVSPATSTAAQGGGISYLADNTWTVVTDGTVTHLAYDTFSRANTAISVGGLGSTEGGTLGPLVYKDPNTPGGASANGGISNGKSVFTQGSYDGAVVNMGTYQQDISVDITCNGDDCRIDGRAAADGSSLVVYVVNKGQLLFYNVTTKTPYYIGTPAGQGPGMTAGQTARGRLVIKDNTISAYLGGNLIVTGSPSVTMPTTGSTWAGFGNGGGSGGAATFDNAQWDAAS